LENPVFTSRSKFHAASTDSWFFVALIHFLSELRLRQPPEPSFDGFEVAQQLLFKTPAGGLLNCTPLLGDRLLLHLPLFAGPRVNRAGQMGNLRPLRADFAFARFRVRIHLAIY
jgi:hypothetical protein